jgi:TP901 family phage tail tape measure protein
MAFRVADALVRLVVDENELKDAVTNQSGPAAQAAASSGKTVGSRFSGAMTAAAAAAITTATTIGALSIGKATGFDEQLRVINTVAKVTDDQLHSIGESILDVSRETGKSTDDLTSGFYDLVSAGVPADKAIAVLRTSAQLATGALGTTGEAVDLMTSALNAYGLSADKAGRVSDIFAQAVADGKVTVADLGGSISQIAPLASSAGVSLEEVAAGFAVLTAKGTPAAMAATEMRAAISALLTPNTQLNEIQQKTGKNFAELAKTKGLAAALDELRKATNGDNDAFAKALGSVEGYQFALASTGDNAAAFAGEQKKIVDGANQGGVALSQYEEVMKSSGAQGRRLVAQLGAAAIELGGPFVGSLGAVLSAIGPMGQGLTGLATGAGLVKGAMKLLTVENLKSAAAFLLHLPALLAEKAALVVSTGVKIAAAVASGGLAAAEDVAAIATTALGVAVNFLLSPIGLIIIAVGLLAAAWSTNFLGIRDIVGGVVDWITKNLGGLVDFVSGAAKVIGDVIGTIANVVGGVLDFIGSVVDAGGKALDAGLDAVQGKSQQIVSDVSTTIRGGRDDWYNDASFAAQAIPDAIKATTPGVQRETAGMLDAETNEIRAHQQQVAAAAAFAALPIGEQLRKTSHTARVAAAQIAFDIAGGLRDKRAAIDGAVSQLTNDIKNGMSKSKEIAHLTGLLIGSELSNALKSADPIVRKQAEGTRALIEDRLIELGAKTSSLGKKAQDELKAGLHSKDPEIKAQAERTKSILDAGLVKKTTAKTPGDAIGDALNSDLGSKGGIIGRTAYQLGRTIYNNLYAGVTGSGYQGSSVSSGGGGGGSGYRVPLAEGLDFVPVNGLPATLHYGEAVLTRDEAAVYRSAKAAAAPPAALFDLGASTPPPVNFIVEGTSATKNELLEVLERARRYRDFGLFDRPSRVPANG